MGNYNYEDEICDNCMYFGEDSCEDPRVDRKHKACRWFKHR